VDYPTSLKSAKNFLRKTGMVKHYKFPNNTQWEVLAFQKMFHKKKKRKTKKLFFRFFLYNLGEKTSQTSRSFYLLLFK